MVSRVRAFAPFLLLAALLIAAGGCSKKDKTDPEPPLTQQEADDLTQVLASMAAIDRGGWLTGFESTLYAFPRSNTPPPAPASAGWAGMSLLASRDTAFTRGPISWSFSYTYFDTSNTLPSWSPLVRYIEGACQAFGVRDIQDFNGFSGSGLHAYSDTLFFDGYRDTSSSFLEMRTPGSVYDSALVTLTSGTESRYYFFDNSVAITVDLPKNEALPPFPLSGEARIDAFVDKLASASRADDIGFLDAVMTISFDGTQTPRASITANTTNPTTVYNYRIDLRTGQITRQ